MNKTSDPIATVIILLRNLYVDNTSVFKTLFNVITAHDKSLTFGSFSEQSLELSLALHAIQKWYFCIITIFGDIAVTKDGFTELCPSISRFENSKNIINVLGPLILFHTQNNETISALITIIWTYRELTRSMLPSSKVSRSLVKFPTLNSQFGGTRAGRIGEMSIPITWAAGSSSATWIAQRPVIKSYTYLRSTRAGAHIQDGLRLLSIDWREDIAAMNSPKEIGLFIKPCMFFLVIWHWIRVAGHPVESVDTISWVHT